MLYTSVFSQARVKRSDIQVKRDYSVGKLFSLPQVKNNNLSVATGDFIVKKQTKKKNFCVYAKKQHTTVFGVSRKSYQHHSKTKKRKRLHCIKPTHNCFLCLR